MGCCQSNSSGALEPVAAQPAVINSKPQAGTASKNPLAFSNKPATAVGDANILVSRRVKFGLVMPESTGASAVYMFFDKEKPVEKMIAAAASHGGFAVDKGKLVGSPERLNLFTLEGDVVRLDLEIEAHMGSTLHAGDTLILEKGNRLDAARLDAVRARAGR